MNGSRHRASRTLRTSATPAPLPSSPCSARRSKTLGWRESAFKNAFNLCKRRHGCVLLVRVLFLGRSLLLRCYDEPHPAFDASVFMLHTTVSEVTARIRARSAVSRADYLDRMSAAASAT